MSKSRFTNWGGVGDSEKGFADLMKWHFSSGRREPWPRFVPDHLPNRPAKQAPADQVLVTMINHATVLAQFPSGNFLTDPVFSERVSPLNWLGPKRVRSPGVLIEDLPPLDGILVSHNHYDHMELSSLKVLADQHRANFYMPLKNSTYLRFLEPSRISELDWFDKLSLFKTGSLQLVPAQHWSARSPFDRNRALWGGFWLEVDGFKLYFAGDSGYGPHFQEIARRLGPPDLALLPIGAYEPRWFMKFQHMNPEEAVLAHLDLGARRSMAIHFGTWRLTDEAIDAPERELALALKAHSVPEDDFVIPKNGQSFAFSLTNS